MQKNYLFTLIAILISFLCFAEENLINNAYFESDSKKTIHKPTKKERSGMLVSGWNIISGKPDYFNTNQSTYNGFPIMKSVERGGRLGLIMYAADNTLEGVQTKLKKPLKRGQKYRVSFLVAHNKYSDFTIKHFPLLFTKNAISSSEIINNTDLEMQVARLDKYITFQDNWVKINMIYEAVGGEEYLTLCSSRLRFTEKKHLSRFDIDTKTPLREELKNKAYYFFDGFEMVEIQESEGCGCEVTQYDNPLTRFVQKTNFNLDSITMVEDIETLIEKEVINEVDPSKVDSFKHYNHHIFVLDISGSMKGQNLSILKRSAINKINQAGAKDIFSVIKFESDANIMLVREGDRAVVISAINSLVSDGGTDQKAGIFKVNKVFRADEKSKVHIITDVREGTIDGDLANLMVYKLDKLKSSNLTYSYKYPTSTTDTTKPDPEDILNKKAVTIVAKNLSQKNPYSFSDLVNEEYSQVFFVENCKFDCDENKPGQTAEVYFPKNYIFLLDVSSSMQKNGKIDALKKSVIGFHRNMEYKDRMSVIKFASRTELMIDRASPIEDSMIKKKIRKLSARGNTKVERGIIYTYNFLDQNQMDENVELILITDGVFDISGKMKRKIKENSQIKLSVVQLGNKKNPDLEKLISKSDNVGYQKTDAEKLENEVSNYKTNQKDFDYAPYSKKKRSKIFAKRMSGVFKFLAS